MQIHETAINHYIQELQKTNFKYIQNKKKKIEGTLRITNINPTTPNIS